jgi:hypothetical protein
VGLVRADDQLVAVDLAVYPEYVAGNRIVPFEQGNLPPAMTRPGENIGPAAAGVIGRADQNPRARDSREVREFIPGLRIRAP